MNFNQKKFGSKMVRVAFAPHGEYEGLGGLIRSTQREHLTEENTLNVVSCVPRSFCILLKTNLFYLIEFDLFGCFS